MDMEPISSQPKEPMQIILFRSKLTIKPVRLPGHERRDGIIGSSEPRIVDVRAKVKDGERVDVVWWRTKNSLLEWRNLMRHREAQSTGRQKWYQYYNMEVADRNAYEQF